jgi:YVTN family beta-propeller protein
VANGQATSNSVPVIDTETTHDTAPNPGGNGPDGVAVGPDGTTFT